jgi:asparagine synthase (glutamine-hydrolysing)
MDSPSIDGFNTYVISRRLAAEGVKVGLSGLGADEFFGGYPTFDRGPRWSRILRATRFFPRDFRRSLAVTIGASFFSADLVEKLADLTAGDSSVPGVTRALRRVLPDSQIEGLGLPANRVGLAQNFLEWQSNLTEPGSDGDLFNAVCRTEITHYMRDTLLRDTDANSMRHALEVRVPFLDLPMVSYVSALRGEVKRGRVPKILLHQAGAHVLPQRVLDRQKTGFTLPIGQWMLGDMRGMCEEAVQSLAEQSFISSSAVRRAWQSFQDNPQSTHWSRPLAFVVLGSYLASAGR